MLAHAYFPPSGVIHFDADEDWEGDTSLLYVAIHEFGHALGLEHTDDPTSVMFPSVESKGSLGDFKLSPGDQERIRLVYGK